MNNITGKIMERLLEIPKQVDEEAPAVMVEELLDAKRVYITGAESVLAEEA